MNKSIRNYLLGSLLAFIVTVLIVALTSDPSKGEQQVKIFSVPTTTTTIPVPAFTETAETQKIPNPCESICDKNIEKYFKLPIVRGPLVQNADATSESCDWSTNEKQYPHLGVSIVLSTTKYDAAETSKISDAQIGDKSYIVKEYLTAFGGSSCGKTIIVEKGEFSYSVAFCQDENNKKPTDKELIGLAKDVEKSLP